MQAKGAGKTGEVLDVAAPSGSPKSDESGWRLGVITCRGQGGWMQPREVGVFPCVCPFVCDNGAAPPFLILGSGATYSGDSVAGANSIDPMNYETKMPAPAARTCRNPGSHVAADIRAENLLLMKTSGSTFGECAANSRWKPVSAADANLVAPINTP